MKLTDVQKEKIYKIIDCIKYGDCPFISCTEHIECDVCLRLELIRIIEVKNNETN